MGRYLNPYQDEPQNFGQFLGRAAQRVSGFLGEQAAAKQQGLLDAQDRQDKLNLRADEAAYRDRVFGETQRHNLAMEQPKPEKAAAPYHPKDFEEAAVEVMRDPNLPDDVKRKYAAEFLAQSRRFNPPKDNNISMSDVPPNVIGNALQSWDRLDPAAQAMTTPAQFYDTRVASGIPRLGAKWNMFNQPQVRDSLRAGFLGATNPAVDTTSVSDDPELDAELKRRGL